MSSPEKPEEADSESPVLIENKFHCYIPKEPNNPIAFKEDNKTNGTTSIIYTLQIHSKAHNFQGVSKEQKLSPRLAMNCPQDNPSEKDLDTFKNECVILQDVLRFMEYLEHGKIGMGVEDSWLKEQFKGLAQALDVVQNPKAKTKILHHNLKLSNILVFGEKEGTIFKISDWGSGSLSKTSERRGDEFYYPPERLYGATSYPHDIWSLDCVLLRVLIWFKDGLKIYKDFIQQAIDETNNKKELVVRGAGSTHFFLAEESGTVLLSTVAENMTSIKTKYPTWKSFVEILEKMLDVNDETRIKVEDLVKELENFARTSNNG
ncbi:hypothetical protein IAQ61_000365 [Plenodomus lingam]|uniref:Protein kinase domain-containing protein n=1 Tax=Leptosphaeria maculans (strain JN3 / isolate v23.1.3 / race Av1-4-5-6-7-8) TaxID=985895 RepID=E5R4R6_LEPMJ|nr:hypothetical protein LEMA_P048950.1 [Plenodomus lingam JN3]KAH9881638.1 hypothetical protein IAQ61_000365 [Plenodomus lingam]CBX92189.1 hypothetical protein LEMA_P048950.1 [Plenodomus lingam JN3]